jgi:DMSO reductase anchor subunit
VAVVLGLLAAVCGLVTVYCQSMIYASLRPIRQWCHKLVPPNLLLICLFSGAPWLAAAAAWDDAARGARVAGAIGVVLALAALVAKLAYWRQIDAGAPVATIESATGLGAIGMVRALESPHTEENYLLREMGYAVGRKHAAQLRVIALMLGFVVPALLLAVGMGLGHPADRVLPLLAALLALAGVYVERWLFFAEATHTVTLYYGRREARAA